MSTLLANTRCSKPVADMHRAAEHHGVGIIEHSLIRQIGGTDVPLHRHTCSDRLGESAGRGRGPAVPAGRSHDHRASAGVQAKLMTTPRPVDDQLEILVRASARASRTSV